MMKIIGNLILLLALLVFSGCSTKTTTCPTYPKPSKEVLDKIRSLQNDKVDTWMMEQFKLNKKLGVCNEL